MSVTLQCGGMDAFRLNTNSTCADVIVGMGRVLYHIAERRGKNHGLFRQ